MDSYKLVLKLYGQMKKILPLAERIATTSEMRAKKEKHRKLEQKAANFTKSYRRTHNIGHL